MAALPPLLTLSDGKKRRGEATAPERVELKPQMQQKILDMLFADDDPLSSALQELEYGSKDEDRDGYGTVQKLCKQWSVWCNLDPSYPGCGDSKDAKNNPMWEQGCRALGWTLARSYPSARQKGDTTWRDLFNTICDDLYAMTSYHVFGWYKMFLLERAAQQRGGRRGGEGWLLRCAIEILWWIQRAEANPSSSRFLSRITNFSAIADIVKEVVFPDWDDATKELARRVRDAWLPTLPGASKHFNWDREWRLWHTILVDPPLSPASAKHRLEDHLRMGLNPQVGWFYLLYWNQTPLKIQSARMPDVVKAVVEVLLEHSAIHPDLRTMTVPESLSWRLPIVTTEGKTMLRKYLDYDIAEVLLEHGADPNLRIEHRTFGDRELPYLFYANREQTVRSLLEHKADPNPDPSPSRNSIVRHTLERDKPDKLRALLEYGSNVTQEDFLYAVEFRLLECLEMLHLHGRRRLNMVLDDEVERLVTAARAFKRAEFELSLQAHTLSQQQRGGKQQPEFLRFYRRNVS